MKVYILQEDILLSKLLKNTMKNQNHEVRLFTHAMEFHQAVLDNKPDMVIIDLLVSYIAGYELISKIRKITSKYIKIVVLSKVNSQNAVQEAFHLGVDEYLIAPFQMQTIVARINRLNRYTIDLQPKDVVQLKPVMA